MRYSFASLAIAFVAAALFSIGCSDPETGKPAKDSHGDHDHDHGDHDHAHDHPAHGPNGGHIFALSAEGHSGEWCKFKDNDVIKMHILDADGKNATPVKVDSFIVKPSVGNDSLTFELEAENADADGNASTFMLDDAGLAKAIPLGVDIEIKIGEQTITGKIAAHEPLDH